MQGYFKPLNPSKYVGDPNNIVFRSSWERKFMVRCDEDPSILKWNSEGLPIPYFSTAQNKERRYYVDFIVTIRTRDKTEETWLIEIKPESQVLPPVQRKRKNPNSYIAECVDWQINQDKWKAAKAYAAKNGAQFFVMTEYDLGIKKRK